MLSKPEMWTKIAITLTSQQHLQVPTSVPISSSFPSPGKPSLKVPKSVTVAPGETLKLSCHFPCKFYSFEKYWCKWSNKGCQALPSQDEGASQDFVNCDQNSRIVSMTLNSVDKEDEGWYWCGVKQGHNYGDTAAVYVAVETSAGACSRAGSKSHSTPWPLSNGLSTRVGP